MMIDNSVARGSWGQLVLLAGLLGLLPVHAAASPAVRTVTLVTGDHVDVSRNGRIAIRAGAGRASVQFSTFQARGHVHVIPSDAVALLQKNQVDPRLFDVTQLLELGYDQRKGMPVIVQGGAAAASAVSSLAAGTRELKAIDAVALQASPDGALWRDMTASVGSLAASTTSTKLWLDGMRYISLDQSVPQIGGDIAHALGFDGSGVTVAVVDTGIDSTHPDLKDKVVGHYNFVVDHDEDERDVVGHGTHVASIIAGTGAASNGRYRGVAPGAKLLAAKVCMTGGCPESAIISGMLWSVEQGAKVVNMSLGGMDMPGEDLLEHTVNLLSSQYGALFVIASGNGGLSEPVGSPASADAALAVGAVDKMDALAPFSQGGPRKGDAAFKPDVVAPGVGIVAALSKDGNLPSEAEGELGPYTQLSGTSMATPHVAGAAALVAQRHPDWKGSQLKALLMGTSHTLEGLSLSAQGAGRIDVGKAVAAQLTAEPAALSFGLQAWPHDDDPCVERSVSFHNDGDSALKLEVSLTATGPEGQPAPEGLFVLSADHLTVKPHGQASLTVTSNTQLGVDGNWLGQIVAQSGDTQTHVPFVVSREIESYDLVIEHIDREGKQALPAGLVTYVVPYEGQPSFYPEIVGDDGVLKLRRPRGKYQISAGFVDPDAPPTSSPFLSPYALLVYPELDLSADQKVTADERLAKPVAIQPPIEGAVIGSIAFAYQWGSSASGSTQLGGELSMARLGPDTPLENARTLFGTTWIAPGEPAASPYQIFGFFIAEGELVNGYQQSSSLDEYAHVQAHFANDGSRADPMFLAYGYLSSDDGDSRYGLAGNYELLPKLPATRDLYYRSVVPGVKWELTFLQGRFEDDTTHYLMDDERSYVAGESSVEQWNKAVFGPPLKFKSMFRVADQLILLPDFYGDASGISGNTNLSDAAFRLFADGKVLLEEVATGVIVDVPPESARYRVEFEGTRVDDAELSTQIKLAWEFVSQTGPADAQVSLPISAARFAPELDDENAVAGKATIAIPITIIHQPESAAKPAEALTVEASFDDGASWQEVAVTGAGDTWSATFEHPLQSGYVSLRASAIDADDNLFEQTIIHAYRLEP